MSLIERFHRIRTYNTTYKACKDGGVLEFGQFEGDQCRITKVLDGRGCHGIDYNIGCVSECGQIIEDAGLWDCWIMVVCVMQPIVVLVSQNACCQIMEDVLGGAVN